MGCYTIYIVRELDGSTRWSGDRWGALEFATGDALLAHVDNLPLHPTTPGFFERSWCRGWYIDRRAKLARVFGCGTGSQPALPTFPDWDVAHAAERRHDLLALAGEPADEDDHFRLLDDWRGCAAAGLVSTKPENFPHRWDPLRQRLEYVYYFHDGCDITVIDHEGRATDYGFDDYYVLFAALGHGHVLLDELATVTPCPFTMDNGQGAVIDVRDKSILVWHREPIGPTTYATLRERWPGWRVQRDPEEGAKLADLPRAIDIAVVPD